MTDHCRGVAKRYPIVDTLGRTREARILSEPDVLRLIVGSKLPAAQRFERWVFEEILPTIRKTGSYGAPAFPDLSDPLVLQRLLSEHLGKQIEAECRAEKAESRLALAMADVRVNNRLVKLGRCMCISDTAKSLDVKRCDLIAFMRAKKWIFRRNSSGPWLAYDDKRGKGWLKHKEVPITRRDGTEIWVTQFVVTPEGRDQLAKEIEGTGLAPGIRLVSDQSELEFQAESKTAIAAPVAEPAPVAPAIEPDPAKRTVRHRGKNRWALADVCEWLSSQLADGPRGGSELRRLAQEAGLNSSPLYRACKVLGVVREDRPGVTRNSQGGSPEKLWRLPPKEDPSQIEGESHHNIEREGQGEAKQQGKPTSWLSRLIRG